MSSNRDDGLDDLRKLLPDLPFSDAGALPKSGAFAEGLLEESLDCVFGRGWTRPGLDWRSRSLVTLGILIALRNGLTRDELEEVIYHAAAYAGFPAASAAGQIGREVLD